MLGDAIVVCIGPTTAAAASAFGWTNVRVASAHSDAGMITTTLDALQTQVVA
jgi:uroporphyrinogen-III synthase